MPTFTRETYLARRKTLAAAVAASASTPAARQGILLFLGNSESPMNYAANAYSFRQDSSFLYYWGIDHPNLAATIDLATQTETLYGDDPTVADIVWTGPQPLLAAKAEQVGVPHSAPTAALADVLRQALQNGRPVHYLPPYRADNILKLARLVGVRPPFIRELASLDFTKAVIAQRSIKTPDELKEIEKAVTTTGEMQLYAMRATRPGMVEREVSGPMAALATSRGGTLAFPVIFTVHGETLHNLAPDHVMQPGQMVVNDCGAESASRYAGDMTRTFPVSGKFTDRQKSLYQIVLNAQLKALAAIKPGVAHRDIHILACTALAAGLKEVGLMKGDPAEAVAAGAHAMFFQCGLGHMMGMDVHDMEDLGEKWVGYNGEDRNMQFGICYLRLAAPLRPGYVITCEPGIYIIPALIDQWKSEHKHENFINYKELENYRDFSGIRIEDDVVVTENGYTLLGPPIPKTIEEVEANCPR